MRHEPESDALSFGAYLDDFTDFLALFAGWGVVLIVAVCLLVMIARPYIVKKRSTQIQRVTTELFVAFAMLIGRNIAAVYVFHRPDMPQPHRVVFWLIVFVLCFRFLYFALWQTWLRPTYLGMWRYVIRPQLRRARGLLKF